jgi:serine protease Do
VGEQVEIKAFHDGQERIFQVLIAARTEKAELAAGNAAFGMEVQEITADIASRLGISQKAGVIVAGVTDGSPADEAGIRPQDLILQVNKIKINSLKDYQREIGKAGSKEGVLLLIKRGTVSTFVSIRP